MGHNQVFPAICMIWTMKSRTGYRQMNRTRVGALRPYGQLIALGIPFDTIKVDLSLSLASSAIRIFVSIISSPEMVPVSYTHLTLPTICSV